MLCQNCQKRVANVHYTQIVNNKKIELYLCEQCAREKGQLGMEEAFNLNDFFSGFLGFGGSPGYMQPAAPKSSVCSECGMSFEEFQKTGKLGCANCYATFSDRLKPLVKRLHGGIKHTGKAPLKVSQSANTSTKLEKLKDMLAKAIQNEEYEKAAEIRDQIKALENSGKQ
ncbi:hypothetical protein CDQ84_17095 [Clostridium thermosuccinogenes]|uniref:UVR domain-containing protein n=1 Tax=Clostridium thermosuccinogenes TaxID=84032 RepID=A0A2K2F7Q1_9CLOT|nr:UvrB/UvrC motif-containing protein [Pseudoclostridium thermosuccinogenes]AUS95571.1 hypothetical protein CDO33_03410 [Pseudoclostridium thermosuccinogenes]PNT94798.1 hypothetical protein CDQ85_16995 [Pseudoclostridium thermosuccinogenes]PNT95426.1 hypothetical protein CDQ84_17095 [Pseudoclostridium thermosuccinogenes]